MREHHRISSTITVNCRRCFFAALLILGLASFAKAQETPFLGAWAISLPDGNPAWLKVVQLEDDKLQAALLWSVGSARLVENPRIENGQLVFERKIDWKPFGDDIKKRVTSPFVATIDKDALKLSFEQVTVGAENQSPEPVIVTGTRISPTPPRPDLSKVRFGELIELFNGKDLTGWRLSNPKKTNGWSAKDGVLVNETPKKDFSAYGAYGNLITERKFEDFELSLEYNVPPNSNSGIYLRGMYEAQVVDRDNKKMQGIMGCGAIFGRITPTKNAGKPGGEWNKYVLTLVDRHITVELNGETVIDNQRLEGCTGGGIQSNDDLPGPIFLQGDHTSVKYRNISLRPVIDE